MSCPTTNHPQHRMTLRITSLSLTLFATSLSAFGAAFTPNNLAIYRVGDGSAALRRGKNRSSKLGGKTLTVQIAEMGQPLYSYQAPTGYSEDSRDWVSSGALVSRLNFALALTGHEIYNVVATPSSLLKGIDEHDRAAMTNRLIDGLLAGDVSDGTRSTLAREVSGAADAPVDRVKLTALILGSPEFQRR